MLHLAFLEVNKMAELSISIVLSAAIVALQLAVFLIIMVYCFLADISFKTKNIHWLNLMSIAFIIVAIAGFLHVFSYLFPNEIVIWPLVLPHENFHLLSDIGFLVAGIGILLFLVGINRNIKEYR